MSLTIIVFWIKMRLILGGIKLYAVGNLALVTFLQGVQSCESVAPLIINAFAP